MASDGYKTLRVGDEFSGELVDRKSRFIAQVRHVVSEDEADAFVARVRARHHDARHNVPAWILSDGRERCSDDGEPQRTSGMPTLEVLRGAGLADVCCVVTRYFGGTLLGPGGLVRAYSAATQAALADAETAGGIVSMTLVTPVRVRIPYSLHDRAVRMVADAGGKVAHSEFAADVTLDCRFRSGEEGPLVRSLGELTGGRDSCEVGEPSFSEF